MLSEYRIPRLRAREVKRLFAGMYRDKGRYHSLARHFDSSDIAVGDQVVMLEIVDKRVVSRFGPTDAEEMYHALKAAKHDYPGSTFAFELVDD